MRVITVLSNLVSKGVANANDVLQNQQAYFMLIGSAENKRTRAEERMDNSGKFKG